MSVDMPAMPPKELINLCWVVIGRVVYEYRSKQALLDQLAGCQGAVGSPIFNIIDWLDTHLSGGVYLLSQKIHWQLYVQNIVGAYVLGKV